jgi:beta-glucosidase
MKRVGKNLFILSFLCCSISQKGSAQKNPLYKNEKYAIDKRVSDLVSRLSIEEKIGLLGYQSKAVERLGIPAYNWWNEGLHGVARAGLATVFPQAIAMAATFNDALIKEVANSISTEARAKYNLANARGRHLQYQGLSFWSPNINIFRDPRWGRGQETYGEDPFLTAQIGTSFVQGLQGNNPTYLKTAATAKHFAVHSGPEAERDRFDAIVNEKDLRETYLYAFNKLVGAGVESVMTAYNSVNGVPSSINTKLVDTILRKEWDFKGHVVTDCGALYGVSESHKATSNNIITAAAAIKAGINLDCSTLLQKDLIQAVKQNLITEKEIDTALCKLLKTQFKLGFFDDPKKSPYANYSADSIHNSSHIKLAREVAQQSIVLLKNKNQILPLSKTKYESIMVVGPNATSYDALLGNYHGTTNKAINFVEGITNAVDLSTRVEYDLGCDYNDTAHFGGIWAAGNAQITIAVMGLSPVLEGEAGDAFLSASGGDRKDMSLPASQIAYLKKLRASISTPIILVVTAGSAVDIAAIEPYADAILLAWYPGEQGGNAMADILFGKVSPSGRLPISFYSSLNDLPAYTEYAMKGRTYRYFDGVVQYPFGYGLSYSTFNYNSSKTMHSNYRSNDTLSIELSINNSGPMDAAEVVQAYVKYPNEKDFPIKELKSFKRVELKKGGSKKIQLSIPIQELKKWDNSENNWKLYQGNYTVEIGANSKDVQLKIPFTVH